MVQLGDKMSEMELIIRIMISNAYYYGSTNKIDFQDKSINQIVQRLNELFRKYNYKIEFTNENYKELMLSIFGDTIYMDDRPYNQNWFGLYDEEQQCLEMIHLSQEQATKWLLLMKNYNQEFIETGSYILTDDIDVFESERQRQDEVYELLLKY